MAEEQKLKCFEIICPKYPKCENAAGSCCAIDDFFENVTISKEDCFDKEDKPFFKEKKQWNYR